ncbi:MAG: hypothetical protein H0T89_33530 [Deltaproteobacteria bacterium]|nr:hypothetical protein [Deltaproteobacteria bacterium]MDQ3300691.1 hypothetical protein [Myxococcota bacterium]
MLRTGSRLIVIGLGLGLAVGACKRDPAAAPPCGAVGSKLLVIARNNLDGGKAQHDDTTRRAVLAQLPAMRDALVHACEDTRWSEGVRRCMVAAVDHSAFEACRAQLTDAQRQALERRGSGSR